MKVTQGFNAFETGDGQWLFVLREDGIYRMQPDGNGAVQVGKGNLGTNLWTIGGKSVYAYDGHRSLYRLPFGSSAFEKVHDFSEDSPESGGVCIAVPNDERFLIFRRQTGQSSVIMLAENFR